MKATRKTHYFLTDLYRACTKKELWLGILGVALSLGFALGSPEEMESSVVDTLLFAAYNVGFMLSFVFCALPFGTSYCEELESGYMKYLLIRGDLKKYVASKTAVIFLSSVAVMALGCILFALICAAGMPWVEAESYDSNVAYEGLLQSGHYILWTGIYGVQWGILAGCLSLAAAFSSLYISNRLLLLAMPVLVYQALTELGADSFRKISWLDPRVVFDARYQLFGSDGKTFLWAAGFGTAAAAALGVLSYWKLKKRM